MSAIIHLRPPPWPVPKPALQLRTDQPGWAQYAIDALGDRRDVMVVHGAQRVRLDGARFTHPIWRQLKNALEQANVHTQWPAGVRQHIPRAAAIAARDWLVAVGSGISADEIIDCARCEREVEKLFGFLTPRHGLVAFDTEASRRRLVKWLRVGGWRQ